MQLSGADQDLLQVIDTMPVPICGLARASRERYFVVEADRGYCAAKKMPCHGFKLGLRIARSGMIVHYPLLAARPHDVKHLAVLMEDRSGVVAADKGFWDPFGQAILEAQQGAVVVVSKRKNMKQAESHSSFVHGTCRYWRKRIMWRSAFGIEKDEKSRNSVELWTFRVFRKAPESAGLAFHANWTLSRSIGSSTSPCKLGNIDFQFSRTFPIHVVYGVRVCVRPSC